jgi:hypothetical protein
MMGRPRHVPAPAEVERIHAEGHLKALDAIGTTAENLKAAIAGGCAGANLRLPSH